jgi:hypothetical protein
LWRGDKHHLIARVKKIVRDRAYERAGNSPMRLEPTTIRSSPQELAIWATVFATDP